MGSEKGIDLRGSIKTHLSARPYRICAIALLSASRPNIAVDRSKSAEVIENNISCRCVGKNLICLIYGCHRLPGREKKSADIPPAS